MGRRLSWIRPATILFLFIVRQTERLTVESPHDSEVRLFQKRLRDRERARQRRATETANEKEARIARGSKRPREQFATETAYKNIPERYNTFA